MKRILCLMTALAALAPACAREQPMRIDCELSMPKTLTSTQPAQLVFTLTNAGGEALQVLNWQTPFEGIKGPIFDVMRDGIAVDYRGRMLKRSSPRKEDYFVLNPGEKKQATIDLADGWDVDAPGKYTVEYVAELFDVISAAASAPRGLDELNPMSLGCGTVAFTRMR